MATSIDIALAIEGIRLWNSGMDKEKIKERLLTLRKFLGDMPV